jgi:hypothetical protein
MNSVLPDLPRAGGRIVHPLRMTTHPATPVILPTPTPGTGQSRRAQRVGYRAEAALVLDPAGSAAAVRTVYVRDVGARSVGFIVGTHIEAGRAALVSFELPDGSRFETRCFVRRCRAFAPRWYDGDVDVRPPTARRP